MKHAAYAIALILGLALPANAEPLALKRGVGVHEWLNWSPVNADGSYVWPPYRTVDDWLGADEFERIKSLGFDFVRLSVDPGPLASVDGEKRQAVLTQLSEDVKRITSTGLNVVFDLHGVSQVPAYSMTMIYDGAASEGVARYRAMVTDVAKMLDAVGTDRVALEPYNEPAYYPCDASGTDDWQRIMTDTVSDIRAVSRDLTIVATGACGGSIKGLANLKPGFDDPNIVYSFHMYLPHAFTHQRSEQPKGFMSGLPWPADQGSPQAVLEGLKSRMDAAGLDPASQSASLAEAQPIVEKYFKDNWGEAQMATSFAEATGWAKANGIPTQRLFMGEFGVILMTGDGRMGAPDNDRLRYIETVRRMAEDAGIPWSMWEYSNAYGMSLIRPGATPRPDAGLLRALGLLRL